MRILLGTIIAGHAKDYAVAKFEEMADALFGDLDVVAVVDYSLRTDLPELEDPRMRGTPWATEIVYYGKQTLASYALTNGYDALIWQGIDCYYTCRYDLHLLINGAQTHPIIGGLVAGRNRPGYAVCRSFIGKSFAQRDHIEYQHTNAFKTVRQVRGYIGSDATLIRRDALETVTMDGYQHWHQIKDTNPDALGPEEFFMWSAVNRHGIIPVVDTRCRPYHCHENLVCARYPNEIRELSEVRWER